MTTFTFGELALRCVRCEVQRRWAARGRWCGGRTVLTHLRSSSAMAGVAGSVLGTSPSAPDINYFSVCFSEGGADEPEARGQIMGQITEVADLIW